MLISFQDSNQMLMFLECGLACVGFLNLIFESLMSWDEQQDSDTKIDSFPTRPYFLLQLF